MRYFYLAMFWCLCLTTQAQVKLSKISILLKTVEQGDSTQLDSLFTLWQIDENSEDLKNLRLPWLMYAASAGNLENLTYLINRGADVNYISKYGTAADWANEAEHFDAINLLLDAGFNPKITEYTYWQQKANDSTNRIPKVVKDGLRKALQDTLYQPKQYYPIAQFIDPADPNLLNGPAASNSTEGDQLLKRLLDLGMEPNLRDRDGLTALMAAVYFNNTDAVELLSKYDTDFNLPLYAPSLRNNRDSIANNNMNPLMILLKVVETRQEELDKTETKELHKMVELLLKHGTNPHQKTKTKQESAIDIALCIPDKKLHQLFKKYR